MRASPSFSRDFVCFSLLPTVSGVFFCRKGSVVVLPISLYWACRYSLEFDRLWIYVINCTSGGDWIERTLAVIDEGPLFATIAP